MELLEYALIGGVLFGLYFALVGLGLNLIFGVMQIVNLAHGDLIMLGAFGAYWVFHLWGLSPMVGIPLEFLGFMLLGIPLYYLLVPRLLGTRDPEMLSFILFFGVSQMIEAAATLGFGSSQRSLPLATLGVGNVRILGQAFPKAWAVSAGVGVAAILALYVYFYRTRYGCATRAVMADRDEARTTGINVHWISAVALALGFALAGLAGVFAPYMIGSVNPSVGVNLTTISFAIVVIGSLGNPLGTIIGGLVYGIALMLMETYFPSWSTLVPYLLLILIMLVKPAGLLGHQVRRA
ncbi:MAG TPA: branched-chain amino acid ABC transporter permease [Nevskiaceae bacterium]